MNDLQEATLEFMLLLAGEGNRKCTPVMAYMDGVGVVVFRVPGV